MISPQQANAIISNLQAQGDILFQLTLKEESKIAKLDDEISELTEAIKLEKNKRNEFKINQKTIGGINATKQNDAQILKQIDILENRLNKLIIRLNENKNFNAELKETIDKYRMTRQTHNMLHDKLSKEYDKAQAEIAAVLERSSEINEQREAATLQLETLVKEENDAQAAFEAKMGEYNAIIERQRAMEMFLKTASKRKQMELEESEGKEFRGDFPVAEESKMKNRVASLGQITKSERENLKHVKVKIKNHEEAFDRLKKKAKTQSLEDVVTMFVHREEINFSIFNHIQVLNREIHEAEEAIMKLKKEKDMLRLSEKQLVEERKKLFHSLQSKVQAIKNENTNMDSIIGNHQEILKQLAASVQNIFFQANCQALMDAMESKGRKIGVSRKNGIIEVTEHSIMQYLGVIEQRAVELTAKYTAMNRNNEAAHHHHQDVHSKSALGGATSAADQSAQRRNTKLKKEPAGPTSPMTSAAFKDIKLSLPRSFDENENEDDEEEDMSMPWSTEEIKKKLSKGQLKTKKKRPNRKNTTMV